MMRYRLTCVALISLLLAAGCIWAGPELAAVPTLDSSGVEAVQDSLLPLEVVGIDLPTLRFDAGASRYWPSGMLQVEDMALASEGDALWLAAPASGLVRWDLDTLQATPVEVPGFGLPSIWGIQGILVAGPEQLWVIFDSAIAVHDHGQWVTLSIPYTSYGLLQQVGLDKSGAFWLVGQWLPMRCSGYPDRWQCVERGITRSESLLAHIRRCRASLSPSSVRDFWRCINEPLQQEFIPLELPADEDWQALSNLSVGITWAKVSGQLVLYSLSPREALWTIPWPHLPDTGSVVLEAQWVTYNDSFVWLFGDGALWMYEPGRWHRFEWPYEAPIALVADPQREGVWASVPALGLVYASADALRLYHPRDRLYALPVDRGYEPLWIMSPESGMVVTALAETTDGRIWAGTDGGGLWRYDEEGQVWRPTELTQALINALLADPDGGLWIGTRDSGVAHYDGQAGWQWWRIPQGLPSDVITALAYDTQGRLWVGTNDRGLARFDPAAGSGRSGQVWETFEPGGGLDNRITALAIDQNDRVFFGCQSGVGMYDGERWVALSHTRAFTYLPTAIVVDDKGRLWVSDHRSVFYGEDSFLNCCVFDTGTGDDIGVLWLDPAGQLRVGKRDVLALLVDRRGRLWEAGVRGVALYDSAEDVTDGVVVP